MKISVSSVFDCPPEKMWKKLLDIGTLIYICKPWATFRPVGGTLSDRWEENVAYRFRLNVSGCIPVGVHEIRLERIDSGKLEIQSRERNKIVTTWDHLITLRETDGGKTHYTDIVELRAGVLTPFVALWSIGFYKHRQRKWRRLI